MSKNKAIARKTKITKSLIKSTFFEIIHILWFRAAVKQQIQNPQPITIKSKQDSIWNECIEETVLGVMKTVGPADNKQAASSVNSSEEKKGIQDKKASEIEDKKENKNDNLSPNISSSTTTEMINDVKVEEKKIDLNFKFFTKNNPPKFVNSKV